MPSRLDFIQRANAGYIEQLYERYRADPDSVPEEWAIFFAGFDLAGEHVPARPAVATGDLPNAGTFGLVLAYREFGHLVARLDPLGENAETHPLLELSNFGLTEADLDRPVDPRPFRADFKGTLRELIAALKETYCDTLGVEFMDISDKARRDWLIERMEPTRNRPALGAEERTRILEDLLTADAFEQFLHVKYVGQKRFSLEGGAALIPMLETLVESAAAAGVEQLVIGMPHRGRLNVLVNILKKPLELVFSEFESGFRPEEVQGHGDVKYHMGYSSLHTSRQGALVHLDLNFNPSHLEFVNPVVLGALRSRQSFMNDPDGDRGIPVLIHGDAAFAGEGIVAETLTLSQLPAYRTGGTVHIVVNNQIGFTTSPEDARPTRYATDLARVVQAPVFHVNGDDPEMAVHAIQLAVEYRRRFHQDAFVDLVCYRRHGHNELDDPTFTQPVMYRKIAQHVPASRQYAQRLVREGVIDHERLETIERGIQARLDAAHRRARADASVNGEVPLGGAWEGLEWAGQDWSAATQLPREKLKSLIRDVARVPAGFHVHPKVGKLLEERIEMVDHDRIDWGAGEMLAFGSLLLEGYRVRLSGQDTGRGTFSHRHAVLHDREDGSLHVPLQHLDPKQGRFDVIDTMLSEAAALGFEYGYSTADPNTLVIWEAQFGDFANVAQVYIDQFIASAESKWRRMSGLTLLLPHGYEGQGPEHSSARIERFLELAADGNMQVCDLTTPAQLFHALRRQMLRRFRKPLVIASPKSLLRHKLAVSRLSEFTDESFHNAIDDAAVPDRREVRTVILTSGRIFFTLHEARAARNAAGTALVRVEQLYPFPSFEISEILARYPKARDIRWVQEEPENMGAWRHLRQRIEAVLPDGATLAMVARRAAPTPATGYYHMHVEQEQSLIERAFAGADAVSRPVPQAGGAAAARRRGGLVSVDITIPRLAESISEAVLVEWLKDDGAPVRVDEPIATLETDKAAVEIAATEAGVLKHARKVGDTVQVGEVLARIEPGAAPDAKAITPARAAEAGAPPPRAPSVASAAPPAPAAAASAPPAPSSRADETALSPAVRKMVEEHGLDPARIEGSGRGGRLLKEDVIRHLERHGGNGAAASSPASPAPRAPEPAPAAPVARAPERAAAAAPAPAAGALAGERVVPMSRIRLRIAERLVQAQHTAAILTTFNEIDMTAVLDLRARYKESFEKRHGVKLGFMSLFARASIAALAEIPELNAEIRGTDLVYRDHVNLGVAVGTERGLVVPVVRDAHRLSFAEIEREIARLAERARDGTLSLQELSGGTFTVSNGGVYGSLLSTPILNPPQSGILGMHKTEKRPIALNDQVVIRPMMYVALSYDHRIVDGEQAVTFLVRVKERLEDPERMLLDV